MTIIATTTTAPATLAAGPRKMFAAGNVPALIAGLVSHIPADENFTPSCIRMTKAAAAAALGGKATPQSFASGLLFAVSAYAYGQKMAGDSIPAHVRAAVEAACNLLKMGAGATRATVEAAALAGFEAMLALPAPAKKEAAAAAPALAAAAPVEAAPVEAAPVEAAPLSASQLAAAAAMLGGPIDNEAAARIESEEAAAAVEAARIEAARIEAAARLDAMAARLADDVTHKAGCMGLAFLEMAAALNIKLTKAQEAAARKAAAAAVELAAAA